MTGRLRIKHLRALLVCRCATQRIAGRGPVPIAVTDERKKLYT
ncbi:hypothetical protein SSTU70S_06779 [Stutzerimonas stutzeri]